MCHDSVFFTVSDHTAIIAADFWGVCCIGRICDFNAVPQPLIGVRLGTARCRRRDRSQLVCGRVNRLRLCLNAERIRNICLDRLDVLVIAVPACEIAHEDRYILLFDHAVLIEVGCMLVHGDVIPLCNIARKGNTVRDIHGAVGVHISERFCLCGGCRERHLRQYRKQDHGGENCGHTFAFHVQHLLMIVNMQKCIKKP